MLSGGKSRKPKKSKRKPSDLPVPDQQQPREQKRTGEVSMSIDQTNATREKLGLPPLRT
jgi:hypothetical protein